MLRGEFVRGDGLVIPNNITTYGTEMILRWAFQAAPYDLHMGLANCSPALDLAIENLGEPTSGVNGYARQALAQDAVDWLTYGTLNGESYLESKEVIFEAVGGNFDAAINRMALIDSAAALTGTLVVALSNPLPTSLTITPTTPTVQRTFKYRIYAR